MKKFSEFVIESDVAPIPKSTYDQIEKEYKRLKALDKKNLTKELGSRLDMSSAESEPKSSLISAALRNKFGGKKVDAWSKRSVIKEVAGYNTRFDKAEPPADQKAVKAEMRKRAAQACTTKIFQYEDRLKDLKKMKEDILKLSDEDFGEVAWDEASDLPRPIIGDMYPDFKIQFKDGLSGFVIRYIGQSKKTVARSGFV